MEAFRRRSQPGESRSPCPPELLCGVHVKRENPVRIFCRGVGVGLGKYFLCIFNKQNLKGLLDLFYDSTNHEINYVDENSASYREADTIPTDSVPTDAIPTIHSQDDPVHL